MHKNIKSKNKAKSTEEQMYFSLSHDSFNIPI